MAARLPGLDLLRAIAIAWVLVFHAAVLFDLVPDPDHWFVQYGWMGVDIFFVLSGFLIASQLFKPLAEGRRPAYGRFFARRLYRTLPAYAVILAVYFLMPGAREKPDIQPLWRFATFTENILVDTDRLAFSQAWSLCVEEQFYLLLPLALVLLGAGARMRKVAIVFGSVLAFGLAVRGWLWLSAVSATPFDVRGVPQWRAYMRLIYYPSWSRLDGLLAGVATAALRVFRPRAWARIAAHANAALAVGVIGIAVSIVAFGALVASFGAAVSGYPLLAASVALVVAAGATPGSVIGRVRVPGAGGLAAISYSLYLSHKIAFHLVANGTIPRLGGSRWLLLAEALVAALLLGTGLYWSVERSFLRLRDRGRRVRLPVAAAAVIMVVAWPLVAALPSPSLV